MKLPPKKVNRSGMPAMKPKIPTVTVGDFYTRHSEALQIKLVGGSVGFDRRIKEPTINRPGLALSGFYDYFALNRIQVLGSAELAYLKNLGAMEQRLRIAELCTRPIPCIVVSRDKRPPKVLIEEANKAGIPVFATPMVTMKFTNAATIALELDFAPSTSEHGSMVDILGVGVMVRGDSGVGKSECVLALIERGYSLVSDDATRLRAIEGRELIGSAPDLTRHHMEVRGLGIINVASMFGIGSIRTEKRLDLVVTLKDWQELEEVDRIGIEQEFYEILGILVPHVTIPVRMGRDLGRLVEVAAMDQKLKSMGQNSAVEFNQRLLNYMERNRKH
ncbi:MAG: HPr(Ser) kinase/phosphatase [Chthoniobacteraceae bacterium]